MKLSNILLDKQNQVKLADFGLAIYHGDNISKGKTCGTPNYMSPEMLSSPYYDYEVDVWAIGVITYHLLVGDPPFQA